MPSIEEILAARKNAKPKTATVQVLLDDDTADQIAQLEAEVDAIASNPDQRLGLPDGSAELQERIKALRVASVAQLVTFEFERLPGDFWNYLTATNPVRPDSIIDLSYGYNLDAVVQKAAKAERGGHSFAWQVDDGKPVVLTGEQWDDVFGMLSGHDASAIRDAVWNLNEWGPAQALAEAKKASAGIETGSN